MAEDRSSGMFFDSRCTF